MAKSTSTRKDAKLVVVAEGVHRTEAREAGVKMKIKLYVDGLPNGSFALNRGTIALRTNRSRNIRQKGPPLEFNDIRDIGDTAIKLLKQHGIAVIKMEGDKKVLVE